MSIGLAGTSAGDLDEAKNILERVAKGEEPGIIYGTIDVEDLIQAGEGVKFTNIEAMQSKKPATLSKLCYIGSVQRDLFYALMGRKFMRGASLNNRQACIYQRALALAWVEKVEGESN